MSNEIDPSMQGVLPVKLSTQGARDLSVRNAFGRVPFVEYFNVDPAVFNGITSADEGLVEPSQIERLLYDKQAGNRRRQPYPLKGWVVLSPSEFAIIPSSAGDVARRVEALNFAQTEGSKRPIDERRASAKRAGAHALDKTVVPKLRNLCTSYKFQIDDMRWLKKEIPNHHLAHGTEAKMRSVAHTAIEVFLNTLDTIGASQDWSGDKLETAKIAMRKRLLHGRGGGTLELKKDYWADLIKVTGNHTIAKKDVVSARFIEADAIINRCLR